jgi:hypothetical protein
MYTLEMKHGRAWTIFRRPYGSMPTLRGLPEFDASCVQETHALDRFFQDRYWGGGSAACGAKFQQRSFRWHGTIEYC